MGGFGQDPIPGGDPAPEAQPDKALTPDTAILCLLNGPGAGRTFPLAELRIRVGRSDPKAGIHADIDLSDCEVTSPPKVSRRHAELHWSGDSLRLLDLGSANGTWHNNERLAIPDGKPPSAPVTLCTGDRIRFAGLEFDITTR